MSEGLTIRQDILDMVDDAGKRHESLRRGSMRLFVTVNGSNPYERLFGKWTHRVQIAPIYYEVEGDGTAVTRAPDYTDDQGKVAAMLRDGFTEFREMRVKRHGRAMAALARSALPLAMAACFALGLVAGRRLPCREKAEQGFENSVEPLTEPAQEGAAFEDLAPLHGDFKGSDAGIVRVFHDAQEAVLDQAELEGGEPPVERVVPDHRLAADSLKGADDFFVHAEDSTTSAKGGAE